MNNKGAIICEFRRKKNISFVDAYKYIGEYIIHKESIDTMPAELKQLIYDYNKIGHPAIFIGFDKDCSELIRTVYSNKEDYIRSTIEYLIRNYGDNETLFVNVSDNEYCLDLISFKILEKNKYDDHVEYHIGLNKGV